MFALAPRFDKIAAVAALTAYKNKTKAQHGTILIRSQGGKSFLLIISVVAEMGAGAREEAAMTYFTLT